MSRTLPRENAHTEQYAHSNVLTEIERGLELTKKCKDFREMRVAFDSIYNGIGIPYAQAYASDVVTTGIGVFNMVRGNTKEAMISEVNMGRDTRLSGRRVGRHLRRTYRRRVCAGKVDQTG